MATRSENPHMNAFNAFTEVRDKGTKPEIAAERALETNLARALAICWKQFSDAELTVFFNAAGLDPVPSGTVDVEVAVPNVLPSERRLISVAKAGVWKPAGRTVPTKKGARLDVVFESDSVLTVIEFKTDKHTPDPTQMAVYARELGLAIGPLPGNALPAQGEAYSVEQAEMVEAAVGPAVTCLTWPQMVTGLQAVAKKATGISDWLANQCEAYIHQVMPQYRGLLSIERLAKGESGQTMLLRDHVQQLAMELKAQSIGGYTIDADEKQLLAPAGSDSDAYISIRPDRFRAPMTQVGNPRLVLWFRHPTDSNREWWGIELYAQASSTHLVGPGEPEPTSSKQWKEQWDSKRSIHVQRKAAWTRAMKRYLEAPGHRPGLEMLFQSVGFRGEYLKWQCKGGPEPRPGDKSLVAPRPIATEEQRAAVIGEMEAVSDSLWHWPEASPNTRAEAGLQAKKIRKAAMAVRVRHADLPTNPPTEDLARWLRQVFDAVLVR